MNSITLLAEILHCSIGLLLLLMC